MSVIRYGINLIITYLGGRISNWATMPPILGWLIAGIILGPNVLGLMNDSIMNTSWYSALMLFVQAGIGIMLGSDLNLENLKESGSKVLTISISEIVTTFVLVTAVFGVILYMNDAPVILATVLGGVATATAPAPAMSITSEYETEGPMTTLISPLVIMNSVLVSLLFFSYVGILESIFSEGSMSVIGQILMMLGVPILLGILLGWVSKFFLTEERSTKANQWLFVGYSVAVIIVLILIDYLVFPEPMANYIIFGIFYMGALVNSIDIEARGDVQEIAGPITQAALFLLILNLAAPLDPQAILSAGLLGVLYTLLRFFAKWIGVYGAAKAQDMDENVQKYTGITLWPHAGKSILLAGIGAESIAPLAPGASNFLMTIVPAGAILSEIVGIIASKKAYEAAGEAGEAGEVEEAQN